MSAEDIIESNESRESGKAEETKDASSPRNNEMPEEEETSQAAAALTSMQASSEEENDEEDDEPTDDGDFQIPLKLTKSGRKRATPFPLKLMKVLSNKEFSDIVAWTPSGKAFNIIQPKVFTADILPSYFKQAKFSSFTRKLHRWGFMRHYRGPEAGAFFHKHFRRGRMDLAEKMSCAKAPSSSSSTPSQKAAKKAAAAAANTAANPGGMSMLLDASASAREGLRNNAGLAAMMGNALGLPQLPPGGLNLLMQQQQLPQQLFIQGFGVPAQPQLLFQQQGSGGAAGAASSGDANLDAAIEREVARRIQERLQNSAAVLSRQPFVIQPAPSSSQTGITSMNNHQTLPSAASSTLQIQSMFNNNSNASGSPNVQSMGVPGFGGNLPDGAYMMQGGN